MTSKIPSGRPSVHSPPPPASITGAAGTQPDLPSAWIPWFLTADGFDRFSNSRWAQGWEIMRRVPETRRECARCTRRLVPSDGIEKTTWVGLLPAQQAAFKQDQRLRLARVGLRPALWAGPLCVTFDLSVRGTPSGAAPAWW